MWPFNGRHRKGLPKENALIGRREDDSDSANFPSTGRLFQIRGESITHDGRHA